MCAKENQPVVAENRLLRFVCEHFLSLLFLKNYNSQEYCNYCKVGCFCSSCCPRFVDCLSNVLDSYVPKMSAFELLKSAYYLCLLGRFPSAPLEKLLQSSMLEQFNSTGKTVNSHMHIRSHTHFFFYLFWSISAFSISSQDLSFSIAMIDC